LRGEPGGKRGMKENEKVERKRRRKEEH